MSFVAIDLGASSGRVVSGTLDQGSMRLKEISRFPIEAVDIPNDGSTSLRWNLLSPWARIKEALRNHEGITSIGIDTWAVDYALLDEKGNVLNFPFSYRDSRTEGIPELFEKACSRQRLFQLNGLQRQNFNTVFQLLSERDGAFANSKPQALLMLPDLFAYWLTGERSIEVSNASTTGIMNPYSRDWDPTILGLMEELGVPVTHLLPRLVEPGTLVGHVRQGLGIPRVPVFAVASHDTASAVAAVPTTSDSFGFISCGTWSLVGTEIASPITSDEARLANFTNELGINNTVRFLKNIMGLWVFNQFRKELEESSEPTSYDVLEDEALAATPLRTVININDQSLFAPGPMRDRISQLAVEAKQPVPRTRGEFYRCILESLALSYASALHEIESLTGNRLGEVHIVGGGTKNKLLCQFTANATQRVINAGPSECTALGNILVQAQAIGAIPPGRNALRDFAKASSETRTYHPQGNTSGWEIAYRFFERINKDANQA